MKNVFGKELDISKELYFLENNYEWLLAEEYELYKNDNDYICRVAAADTNSRGKNELYLVQVTARGYGIPTSTRGCRLRTGNPEYGR